MGEDAIPPQCICLGRPDKAAYAEGLLKQMRKFWQEGALCDALLVSADGTEFPVHRLILASGSDELGALVNGQFAEGDQVRKGEPVKVEVPSNVLLAVLDFIYGAEPVITIETGLDLLPVAHRLGLMHLVELLEPAIGPSLQPWSVGTSLILSQDLGLRQLHTRAVAKKHHLEAESFGKLSAAQLGRILRREDLKVDREETVLEAVLRWHQSMERGRDAGALLPLGLGRYQFMKQKKGGSAGLGGMGNRGKFGKSDFASLLNKKKMGGMGGLGGLKGKR
eukprot:s4309_g1.t1